MTTRLDHVSFGVHDARAWAAELRRTLGATPVAGEVLRDFRWVMFYLGTAECGGRLEIMEPERDGFLTRFLAQHGEAPHHLTFMVDDVRAAVQKVRDLGLTVVGENYGFAPWEEAFVFPDERLGVVVQLAQSSRRYPEPAELVATDERHPERYPASRDAQDINWWAAVWREPQGPASTLLRTELASSDPGYARLLFEDVLGARRTSMPADGLDAYAWPGGVVHVTADPSSSGVTSVDLTSDSARLTVGNTRIGPPDSSPDGRDAC